MVSVSQTKTMGDNTYSSLLMRYNKLWHPLRIEQAEEVLHPEFARHGSSGSCKGILVFKQYVKHFMSAFPDIHFLFRDWLWEGDKVAARYQLVGTHKGVFLGIAPTGKQKRIEGASIYRFADGKIIEVWDFLDRIALISEALPLNFQSEYLAHDPAAPLID
jgi:predicted ester cyclase